MRESKLGSGGAYPKEMPIGPGMRVLFAVLGVAALVAVVLIAMIEFHEISGGSRAGALIVLAFCAVVVIGALLLIRGSITGVAVVRRPRG